MSGCCLYIDQSLSDLHSVKEKQFCMNQLFVQRNGSIIATLAHNIHDRWKIEHTEVQNPLKYLLGLSLTCEYEKSTYTAMGFLSFLNMKFLS